MSGAALSTMWMQHRFESVTAFAHVARDLGFGRIELSHYVTPGMLNDLQLGETSVSSVHYPAPTVPHASGAGGDKYLASPDKDKRRWAVEQGFRTIEYAAEVGADAVCLHLGWVQMETHLCWALEQRH